MTTLYPSDLSVKLNVPLNPWVEIFIESDWAWILGPMGQLFFLLGAYGRYFLYSLGKHGFPYLTELPRRWCFRTHQFPHFVSGQHAVLSKPIRPMI